MAIYCELKDGMGLGNQLWTMLSTKGIAEHLGVEHYTKGYKHFLAKNFLTVETNTVDYFPNDICNIAEKSFYWKKANFLGCLFDDRFFTLNTEKDWLITGLLQDERYLSDIGSALLFNTQKEQNILTGTVICNVRGGEYRLHRNFQLKKNYWLASIQKMKEMYPHIHTVIGVSDDYEFCRKLGIFDKIIAGNIRETFELLTNAMYVVASNSTFSYFPVKLNNNVQCVIAPAFYNRPHQHQMWCSPQNHYEAYSYIDQSCNILPQNTVKNHVYNTEAEIYKAGKIFDYGTYDPRSNILKRIVPNQMKSMTKRLIRATMGY